MTENLSVRKCGNHEYALMSVTFPLDATQMRNITHWNLYAQIDRNAMKMNICLELVWCTTHLRSKIAEICTFTQEKILHSN